MLVLGRKVGEILEIHLAKDVDPNMTVNVLFANGPIKVVLVEMTKYGEESVLMHQKN